MRKDALNEATIKEHKRIQHVVEAEILANKIALTDEVFQKLKEACNEYLQQIVPLISELEAEKNRRRFPKKALLLSHPKWRENPLNTIKDPAVVKAVTLALPKSVRLELYGLIKEFADTYQRYPVATPSFLPDNGKIVKKTETAIIRAFSEDIARLAREAKKPYPEELIAIFQILEMKEELVVPVDKIVEEIMDTGARYVRIETLENKTKRLLIDLTILPAKVAKNIGLPRSLVKIPLDDITEEGANRILEEIIPLAETSRKIEVLFNNFIEQARGLKTIAEGTALEYFVDKTPNNTGDDLENDSWLNFGLRR